VTTTSLPVVKDGIAQFFGGSTYDTEARAYRGSGPLQSYGLSTVRKHQPKRMPDVDYVMGQSAGRGMGAVMIVELPLDTETRQAKPAYAGRKRVLYQVVLHVFHFGWQPHAEDAQEDAEDLIEAIKDLMHSDITLGGIPGLYQSGESRTGIRTRIFPSDISEEKVATYLTITFDAEVEIVA
jgi:hypothetical protein